MATDLISRGKVAYKQGSYEEAARLFRIASASTSRSRDLLSAYDLEIGAMVKMRTLEPALQVAKSMIRTNRRDARGYIRAAQVERLANRPQAAARWYQHGIKHISSADPLRSSLQSGLKKCDAQLTQARIASRPCDPFTTLPIEVARLILEQFDYRQRVAVLRVSRGWRSFLAAEPVLTETLDFSNARRELTVEAVGACLRRLNQYPSAARLRNLSGPAARDLGERLPHWLRRNQLRSFLSANPLLRFPTEALPDQSLITALTVPLTLSDCQKILTKCPSLERLHVTEQAATAISASWSLNSSSIQDLRIVRHHASPRSIFLGTSTPNLRILHLTGLEPLCCRYSSLRSLHLRNCMLNREIRLPPTITALVLVNNEFYGTISSIPREQLALPNLVHLQAPLDEWGRSWEDLAVDPMKVETVDVQDQDMTDERALFFAGMTSLKRLTVSNGRRLSGVFVKDLIEKSSNHLEYIGLVNCENVSPSTASWAWKQHQFRIEVKTNNGRARARDGRRVFT